MSLPDPYMPMFLPSQGDGDAPTAAPEQPQHATPDLIPLLGSQDLMLSNVISTQDATFWGDQSSSQEMHDLAAMGAFTNNGYPGQLPGPHPNQLLAPFPVTGPMGFPFAFPTMDVKPLHPSLLKQGA
jgi:hypothetical protein